MPPKLFLNVHASVRESLAPGAAPAAAGGADDGGPSIAALHAPSIEIGPSGTLKLFKSLQAFEFNPLGMKRSGAETAPLASGAAALQSAYRVGAPRPAALRQQWKVDLLSGVSPLPAYMAALWLWRCSRQDPPLCRTMA